MAKTIKDVIEEVVVEIDTEDINQEEKAVMGAIEGQIRELKGQGVTGMTFDQYTADELSKIGGSLAILKVTLGEMIAKATKNLRISEHVVTLKKANLREPMYDRIKAEKDTKPTVDEVKAQINRQVFKDQMRSAFKEEHLVRLQHLWWALKTILDVISQRISIKMGEEKDSKWLDQEVVPDVDLSQVKINQDE